MTVEGEGEYRVRGRTGGVCGGGVALADGKGLGFFLHGFGA